jgi:hypothetical protein
MRYTDQGRTRRGVQYPGGTPFSRSTRIPTGVLQPITAV